MTQKKESGRSHVRIDPPLLAAMDDLNAHLKGTVGVMSRNQIVNWALRVLMTQEGISVNGDQPTRKPVKSVKKRAQKAVS